MSDSQTFYTKDRQIRIEMKAFHTDLLIYKAIGASAAVRKLSKAPWWKFWASEEWTDAPAQIITIRNTYTGRWQVGETGVTVNPTEKRNVADLEVKLEAFGVSLSLPGALLPVGVGAAATLEVRAVSSEIFVQVAGESFHGVVQAR